MIEQFIKSENWAKAYKIAKTHTVSISKEDMRNIQIALDCLNGKSGYYKSLGIDTEEITTKAQEFMKRKYL